MSNTACPAPPQTHVPTEVPANASVARPDSSTHSKVSDQKRSSGPLSWNVVLHDDQDHTYDYVIRMMIELFAQPKEKAFQTAECVDQDGRAICLTTHKELAELKRDQILAYGKDPLMSRCKGSMSATIEPADGGEGDDKRDRR